MFNFCRFCAERLGLKDWSEYLQVSKQYELIHKSFTDYIDINDALLPKTACGACFHKYNEATAFYNKVKQSQIMLKKLYNDTDQNVATMQEDCDFLQIKTEIESDILVLRQSNDDKIKDSQDISTVLTKRATQSPKTIILDANKPQNSIENQHDSGTSSLLQSDSAGEHNQDHIVGYKEQHIPKCFVLLNKIQSPKSSNLNVIQNEEANERITGDLSSPKSHEDDFDSYMDKQDESVIKDNPVFKGNPDVNITNSLSTNSQTNLVENGKEIEANRNSDDSWTSYKWVCHHCTAEFKNMTELRTHSKAKHKICYAFKCIDCEKNFNVFNSFIKHIRQHRKILRLFCEFCNKSFKSFNELNKHASVHSDMLKKFCNRCGQIFENQTQMLMHIIKYEQPWRRGHITLIVKKCQLCGATLNEYNSWKMHMTSHLNSFLSKNNQNRKLISHRKKDQMKFICKYCGKKCPNRKFLDQHLCKHLNKHKCDLCGKTYFKEVNLKYHVYSHYLWFHCNNCDKPFSCIKGCVNHMESRHGIAVANQDVKTTSKIDTNTGSPVDNSNDPALGTIFICNNCAMPFKTKKKLEKHILWHENKTYQCNLCGKQFRINGNLKRHMATHMSSIQYSCYICMKSFTTSIGRTVHMRSSHKMKYLNGKIIPIVNDNRSRDFICRTCGKTYLNKCHLVRHAKRHNIKTEECKVCKERFHDKDTLKQHSIKHTELRPFVCSECDKAFKTKRTLQIHMKTHMKINRYKCSYCNKEFYYKRKFKLHEMLHKEIMQL